MPHLEDVIEKLLGASFTANDLQALAHQAARNCTERHPYLPVSVDIDTGWQAHQWVIESMVQAVHRDRLTRVPTPNPSIEELTDDVLLKIAQHAAVTCSERHPYLPEHYTPEWLPHAWVLDAQRRAIQHDRQSAESSNS